MKNFDVRNVVRTYCSVAQLKECEYHEGMQIAATHIFGAQQLATLYWSECGWEFDIQKVVAMIAFHEHKNVITSDDVWWLIADFNANTSLEAKLAHFFCDMESWIQSIDIAYYLTQVKYIKSKYYGSCNEAKISDAKYDELCAELTQWRDTVDLGYVSNKLVKNIIKAYPEFCVRLEDLRVMKRIISRYCILCELKDKVRKGPIYWNVNVSRYEVVSEHAFGTQSIAWLMETYGDESLDIYKIVWMLAHHETEEAIMPDFTPYDPVSPERMLEMGRKAVKVIFGGLKKYEVLNSLLDEFNAKETPEAMFAYRCDKLEFNFRIKMYCDLELCTIEGGQAIVKNDPEIQKNIARGAKTVADLIAMHEIPKFIGTDFEQIVNCLKTYDTRK